MPAYGFPHPRAGYFGFGQSTQSHRSDASAFGSPAILTNAGQRPTRFAQTGRAANPALIAFLGDA